MLEPRPDAVFAVPGSLETPTGGYRYDREIVEGLRRRDLNIKVLDLGATFPFPSAADLRRAEQMVSDQPPGVPVIVDGLAYGVMPDAAANWADNRPVIALVHHPLADEPGHDMPTRLQLLDDEARALRQANAVVVTGAETARLLAVDYGVAPTKLSIIRPGVTAARALPHASGPVRLIAIGAVTVRKAFADLVAALGRVEQQDWTLTLVGALDRDAGEVARVRSAIDQFQLADRITLAGALNEAEKTAKLEDAHLFVASSLYEGYGMALAEAVATGLYAITTDVGAARELVADGSGAIVPVGDTGALTSAIDHAMERITGGSESERWTPTPRDGLSWDNAARAFADLIRALT
ncbi:MAG: glycosyltransferase family 4 protein [Pseudomonadota bacterium]